MGAILPKEIQMAFKSQKAEVAQGGFMLLEILGLRATDVEHQFSLEGIQPVDVDYMKIEEVLTDAGLNIKDARAIVEELSETVFQQSLARAIAQRTKRVG
jgi:hypothetical protein